MPFREGYRPEHGSSLDNRRRHPGTHCGFLAKPWLNSRSLCSIVAQAFDHQVRHRASHRQARYDIAAEMDSGPHSRLRGLIGLRCEEYRIPREKISEDAPISARVA